MGTETDQVQTELVIEARRPDMIVTNKKNNLCNIIDIAVPYDSRVNAKEMKKLKTSKFSQGTEKDLEQTIESHSYHNWSFRNNSKTPKLLRKRLEDTDIETRIVELLKISILYSARIIRKVLEI